MNVPVEGAQRLGSLKVLLDDVQVLVVLVGINKNPQLIGTLDVTETVEWCRHRRRRKAGPPRARASDFH